MKLSGQFTAEQMRADSLSYETLTNLSRSLGADPRELMPCGYGTKVSLVRRFNNPTFGMDWERFFKRQHQANVALLFGRTSRFIGIDCDSPAVVDAVSDCFPSSTHVQTHRGILFLARSDVALDSVTCSTALTFKYRGMPAGEVRLQNCYSVVHGLHPSGSHYALHGGGQIPVFGVRDLLGELAGRGLNFGSLQPPAQSLLSTTDDTVGDGLNPDALFWTEQAAHLGRTAQRRDDGTVSTNPFVFALTTGIRTRPDLVGTVVSSFIRAVCERGLNVRGGFERLEAELGSRVARWSRSYGTRVKHQFLRQYYRPSGSELRRVFVRFPWLRAIRKDLRDVVEGVGTAFVARAVKAENKWRYEPVRALAPEVSPAAFSRVVSRLVEVGLLERAENSLPSKLPPHMRAKWMYRVREAVLVKFQRTSNTASTS
jgi:hypothetical protein